MLQYAGQTGLDPGPLTFAQLRRASRAKSMQDWDIQAPLLCLLANANRDAKKRRRPYTIYDFHPLRERPRRKITRATFSVLKCFVPKPAPRLSGPTNYKL